MEQILLTKEEKNQILDEYGVARSTMLAALKGERNTALANIIRKRAKEIISERRIKTV